MRHPAGTKTRRSGSSRGESQSKPSAWKPMVVKSQGRITRSSGKSRVACSVTASPRRRFASLRVVAPAWKVQKQVYALTLEDLRRFPVWEFRLDGEGGKAQDESTVRPYTAAGPLDPIDAAERMFVVRAVFRLADGSSMQGYCSPALREDDSIGVMQPVIVTECGQIPLWCGTAAPDSERLARNYAWLGKDAESVFPMEFESDGQWVGCPITGHVPGFLVLEDFQTRRTRTVV